MGLKHRMPLLSPHIYSQPRSTYIHISPASRGSHPHKPIADNGGHISPLGRVLWFAQGCPFQLQLASDDPDMGRTSVRLDQALLHDGRVSVVDKRSGSHAREAGGKDGRAGKEVKAEVEEAEALGSVEAGQMSIIDLSLYDRFDNVAIGGANLVFGMLMVPAAEKDSGSRWRQAEPDSFSGVWEVKLASDLDISLKDLCLPLVQLFSLSGCALMCTYAYAPRCVGRVRYCMELYRLL